MPSSSGEGTKYQLQTLKLQLLAVHGDFSAKAEFHENIWKPARLNEQVIRVSTQNVKRARDSRASGRTHEDYDAKEDPRT